jgi:N-acetyl-gamma-glutamyl-phosphate reductase
MKAAVIGATGYTGMVLLRLLEGHPDVDQILAVSSSKPGDPVNGEDPGLGPLSAKYGSTEGKYLSVDQAVSAKPDVVFAALPHLASASVCSPFFGKTVVIDLSADFRIKDRAVFSQAYGQEPPRPDLLDQAVYGLAEWHTEAVRRADLIANPGCYTTCSLLPLLPLYREGLAEPRVVINALSGVSGAGKKVELKYLFTERTESVQLYSPGRKHRHTQEIEAELRFADPSARVLFNPHLVPLKRGMEATIVVDLKPGRTLADAEKAWVAAYPNRPFARYVGSRIPASAEVWGSNRCDWSAVQEGDSLVVSSVLDNLVKGASGQAVQNMNLRFGLPETSGLSVTNLF